MEKALEYAKKMYGEDIVLDVKKILRIKNKEIYSIETNDSGDIGLIKFIIQEGNNFRLSNREEMDFIVSIID